MGATESKILSPRGDGSEEGIVTVAVPALSTQGLDPLLQQLQQLEQSFPLLEESLGTDGWRVVQKFYAGKGLTLDAQALQDLIQQYQACCKSQNKHIIETQAQIHSLLGSTEKEAEAVAQLVSRSVSQASLTAANLKCVEELTGEVEALGERMALLQATLEELSQQVEQASLSRALPHEH